METDSPQAEARDLAQRRLRRMTMRIGAVALGGVGVLGAVAAFTLPGHETASALAAGDPGGAEAGTGTALSPAPGRDGDDEGQAATAPAGQATAPLQPAQSAPRLPTFGPARAVTGGSR